MKRINCHVSALSSQTTWFKQTFTFAMSSNDAMPMLTHEERELFLRQIRDAGCDKEFESLFANFPNVSIFTTLLRFFPN